MAETVNTEASGSGRQIRQTAGEIYEASSSVARCLGGHVSGWIHRKTARSLLMNPQFQRSTIWKSNVTCQHAKTLPGCSPILKLFGLAQTHTHTHIAGGKLCLWNMVTYCRAGCIICDSGTVPDRWWACLCLWIYAICMSEKFIRSTIKFGHL